MGKVKRSVSTRFRSADSEKGAADFVNGVAPNGLFKRVYLLVGLLLALAVMAWYVGAPGKLLNSFARASLAEFDIERADAWLQFSASYFPSDSDRELLLARIARKKSDYSSMDKHLAKAKVLGASVASVQMEEAMAAAQAGALELVEVQLFQWMQRGLGEIDELSDAYANGLAANSRFEPLNQVLDAWQRDFPADPRPDYRRGRIQEYFQLWEQAEEAYKQSLSRNSRYTPSRFRLGRVLMLQRRMEEARDQFLLCCESTRPEAAKTSLAICYRALGEAERARGLFEDVLLSSHTEIEMSYSALGETPEYFEAASNLGDLESEAGNYGAAEKWLRVALDKNQRDLQTRYSLAVTLRELGRMEEAQTEFDRVTESRKALEQVNPLRNQIAENPTDPAFRVQLGELLMKYESERSGRFWINSAFSFDPHYKPAHEALARYYRQLSLRDPMYKELAEHHVEAAKSQQK